ncbi:MAG: cytochrome C oxidase subunit IV family protein [bacterium]
MSGHADIQKQVRGYKLIFAALAVGTVITVAVSYIHLPIAIGLVVALLIATVKGSLVAGWFMHLKSEVKPIYWLLGVSVLFFLLLLLWPLLDINGGEGKHSVMEGVVAPWDPETGHAGGAHGGAHDDGHGGASH